MVFGTILFCITAVTALVWLKVYGHDFRGKIQLINQSHEEIKTATVRICGQTFSAGHIAMNETRTGSYKAGCEDHFTINVTFSSGKTLSAEDGYVTDGFHFASGIIVSDQAVTLAEHKSENP